MFKFWLRDPLMMPAGTGGGGGGAGAGDPSNPGAFNADEFMAKLTTSLTGVIDTRINAMDKRFKAIEEKLAAKPAGGAGGGDPADPGANPGTGNNGEPTKAKTTAELTLELTTITRKLDAEVKKREAAEKVAGEEKARAAEETRKNVFLDAIKDFPFATGKDGNSKARQQFIDAYLPKVKRNDETGDFHVETEAGPVSVQKYMQAEFEASPHLAAPTGTGGAGASAGTKVGGGRMPDYASMSASQIAAIPAAERDAHLAQLVGQLNNAG